MRQAEWRGRATAALRGVAALLLSYLVLKHAIQPVLVLLLGSVGPAAVGQFERDHVIQPGLLIATDVRGIVEALLAASLMLLTERGGWTPARLLERTNLPRSSAALGQGLAGLAAGAAAMILVLGALFALGNAHAAFVARPLGAILRSLAVWLVVFALVGAAEELLNRGYPLRALTEGIGFRGAAFATSLWFAWLHLHEGDPWFGALGTGLFGMFLALTWRATGSLAFAIGFHASWDTTQSVIFGVPDSSFTMSGSLLATRLDGPVWLAGGTVGPEGSLLAYVVLVALILLARHAGAGRPFLPARC